MTPSQVLILVVDDVQTVRIQVKEILRSCGFENVKSAANGLEALKMLNEEDYHCVIADWYMSPMSGLELLKEVRSKDKLKNLAYVMLTAESTKEKVVEAIKSGLDDFIMKPFTKEHAQLKLTNALIKRKVL